MITIRRTAALRGYVDQGTTTRTWGGWSLILGGIAGLLTYAGTSKPRMGAAAGFGVLGAGLTVSAAVYYRESLRLGQCTHAYQTSATHVPPEGATVDTGLNECVGGGGERAVDLDKATWAAGGVGLVSLVAGLYLWKGKRR